MNREAPLPFARRLLHGGFTLVEMLVAVAVLGLLIAMVSQLMSSATATISNGSKQMDTDSQARVIFDRMADDFDRMVKRPDADCLFAKQSGNDSMYFFGEGPAYFDPSLAGSSQNTVALLGYRINSSYQLERLGKGLTWDGTPASASPGGMPFLTYSSGNGSPDLGSTIAGNWPATVGNAPAYSSGSDSDYHVLADQAFRMEISFLLTSGTLSAAPYIPPHTAINGFEDVSAIVVTLAILDSASEKTLSNSSLAVVAGALPDAANGVSTAQAWLQVVEAGNFAQTAQIPQTAASHVRVYQRYFYLNK